MLIVFSALVKQFQSMGEKSGWTYIEVPLSVSEAINPGVRKAYRVSGKLNDAIFEQLALTPMGGGQFILAMKKDLRKKAKVSVGYMIEVQIQRDDRNLIINKQLIELLKEEPDAWKYFQSLAPSHQLYFSKWIDTAKTEGTILKRLTAVLGALEKKWDYGQMIRNERKQREF